MKTLTYKREFEAENLKHCGITIENYNLVIQSTDEQLFRLEMEANVNEDVSEEIAKSIFDFDINDEELELIVKTSSELSKVKIRIEIPKSCFLEITGKSGNIEIRDCENSIEVKNSDGKISIFNCQGSIELDNINGSIKLENISGNIESTNSNGSIHLKKCSGNMELVSKNGSIKLVKCEGDLECNNKNGMIQISESNLINAEVTNQNGAIYYEFESSVDGDFEFETTNGKIQLIIPESIEYDLTAKTRMGRLNITLPGDYQQSRQDGYKIIQMQRGSGDVSIKATSKMGSIILSDSPRADKKNRSANTNYWDPDKIETEISEAINSGIKTVKDSLENLNLEGFEIPRQAKKIFDKIQNKIVTSNQKTERPKDENSKSKMKILQLLQDKKITVDEAAELLEALEE